MPPHRVKVHHHQHKKIDSIGQAVFYPSTFTSSPLLSQPRYCISTQSDSSLFTPPTSPRPSLRSTPTSICFIGDMSGVPGTPGRSQDVNQHGKEASSGQVYGGVQGQNEEEGFPFPDSSHIRLDTTTHQVRYLPPSPYGLSTMIENWNLATPPGYPPAGRSSTFGLPESESIDSLSTVGTEVRSPPDLPSTQGFHSRILPTSDSPAQQLRQSLPRPKAGRRSSAGQTLTFTPVSPLTPPRSSTLRSSIARSPDIHTSLLASPGNRSPIPLRQPSWSESRRGSVPLDTYRLNSPTPSSPQFLPPTGLRSPSQIAPMLSSSPLAYTPVLMSQNAPPTVAPQISSSTLSFQPVPYNLNRDAASSSAVAPPLSFDLFTPGYDMGSSSSSTSNALGISLSAAASQYQTSHASNETFGGSSFRAPSYAATHQSQFTGTSTYSNTTHQSAPSNPHHSKVAAKYLENHPLPQRFSELYVLADELGAGGFGFVCSALMTGRGNERGREVAVKFIFKEKLEKTENALVDGEPMESWVLRQCNHPSIVSWVDYYEDDKYYILVQELHGDPWSDDHTLHSSAPEPHTDPGRRLSLLQIPSYRSSSPLVSPLSPLQMADINPFDMHMTNPDGSVCRPRMGRRASHDLFEAVESVRFTEEEAKWIFKQIVSGVSYLHGRGIYHRDLKDENIVIDRYLNVKIIDFGSAVVEDTLHAPNLYGSFRGTYSYASPEVLTGQWYRASPCDIWSIGIILSILLTGEQPFPDSSLAIQGRPRWKRKVSDGARDLMEKMFKPEPRQRWGIDRVERHKWLKSAKRPKHLPNPPITVYTPPLQAPGTSMGPPPVPSALGLYNMEQTNQAGPSPTSSSSSGFMGRMTMPRVMGWTGRETPTSSNTRSSGYGSA